MLFLWFFNHRGGHWSSNAIEAIILALAQCYYYRLNQTSREQYSATITEQIISKNYKQDFLTTLQKEEKEYVYEKSKNKNILRPSCNVRVVMLVIPAGIAQNQAFRENVFVMLVGLATKTPTIVVGRPGSSKTLAMNVLLSNLSSSAKNKMLSTIGLDDFFVLSFQCSKMTTSAMIEKRWKQAVDYQNKIKFRLCTLGFVLFQLFAIVVSSEMINSDEASLSKDSSKQTRSVVLWLDEVGLAEWSPHRPLKVLHKLLEDNNNKIAFIGLRFELYFFGFNWRLDAAKMNRLILHQVPQPKDSDLKETADTIIKEQSETTKSMSKELEVRIPNITLLYRNITQHNPFNFDFFGYRDFYALASYLKYKIQKHSSVTQDLLMEAALRNFGGMTKKDIEIYLLPKIKSYWLNDDLQIDPWKCHTPLHLIKNNIEQAQDEESPDIRNIMFIADYPAMWKILFDSGITSIQSTEVIFGSRFAEDQSSAMYLYQIIEKMRRTMNYGGLCILLQLDQLYDSLYDVLNQKYETIDNQKFCYLFFCFELYCRICVGGESIRCRIAKKFRCAVVVSKAEAHHEAQESKYHVPVAFLSRFEKFYLDPTLLEDYSLDPLWKCKWEKLQQMQEQAFFDLKQASPSTFFVGFVKSYTYISLLMNSFHQNRQQNFGSEHKVSDEEQIENAGQYCLKMLLQNTSLEKFLRNHVSHCDDFKPYADIVTFSIQLFSNCTIDVIEREGTNETVSNVLLQIVTHDYQVRDNPILDGRHGLYVVTRDKSLNSHRYLATSLDEYKTNKEIKVTEIRFKDLRDFVRETDFTCYVTDFLSHRPEHKDHRVLVIACESPMNNDMLAHHAHTQYLIEKAASINRLSNDTSWKKTIVLLCHRSNKQKKNRDRTNTNEFGYPLIFSSMWKRVFLDALLPSKYAKEVQINDICIANMSILSKRLEGNGVQLLTNSYEQALNHLNFADNDLVQIVRGHLTSSSPAGKKLQHVMKKLLNDILVTEKGALACLKALLEERLDDRGSLRRQFMLNLTHQIKHATAESYFVFSYSNDQTNKNYVIQYNSSIDVV
ncbi:hypothetical protein RFI_08416 [Reticulomyxa filosa]|uniref:AAA+ ATPase domain-containing protein n=1 Tax=Reticulomyxa filosa TaxID=46433 RepID=X6NRQ9_RETFI|nr:hypothetical protein RFI_08416 [Reticulomyxa filosa]|eukprot:ETO28711.1 hypothetical protein RFI_08416 [Reticulomyxa filosa]